MSEIVRKYNQALVASETTIAIQQPATTPAKQAAHRLLAVTIFDRVLADEPITR